MNQNIFRAYDIRGVYGEELNEETARLIGKAFVRYLARKYEIQSPRIIVGKDNRSHGKALQDAFIGGALSQGAEVDRVEDCPSPMLYHAVCEGNYTGGVNITASHNPPEYNGFKLLGEMAHSIAGEEIQIIKQMILDDDFEPAPEGQDRILTNIEIAEPYYQKIQSLINLAKPLKIVIDAGNGISGKYYPEVFRRLGCEVVELYCEQDGNFPNHQPDPIVEANTEDLKKKVLEEQADLGVAFDGDGDRCGIIDEKGHFHDANESFVLLIRDILSRHPGSPVVYTVSNSLVIPETITELGGKAHMVPVGHSFVEIAMNDTGAMLGGEQSGHFFVAENYFGYDDAAYAAGKLVEFFSRQDQSVSQLYDSISKTFSSPEMRPHCPDDKKFEVIQKITADLEKEHQVNTMDGVRVDFDEGGWLGIRASNTSPKLSILMEAHNQKQLDKIHRLAKRLLKKEGIEIFV